MTEPSPSLSLARPKSLCELAVERLRNAIVDADFKFGELLSENTLAEDFRISKTPIHEALVLLEAEGLVEILPQRGARVFQPSIAMIKDICEYRLLLEMKAVQLSFERNRAHLIADLEGVVRAMIDAWEMSDHRKYLHLDTAYHDLFYRWSGSQSLRAGYAVIRARAAAIRTQIVANNRGTRRLAFDDHQVLVEMLHRAQLDRALDLLKEHVWRLTDLFADAEGAKASAASADSSDASEAPRPLTPRRQRGAAAKRW